MNPSRVLVLYLPFLIAGIISAGLFGAPQSDGSSDPQGTYEREIQAIVRNKYFYKTGRLEATFNGGVMPYDSLVNHYMLGGKFTWHIADH